MSKSSVAYRCYHCSKLINCLNNLCCPLCGSDDVGAVASNVDLIKLGKFIEVEYPKVDYLKCVILRYGEELAGEGK